MRLRLAVACAALVALSLAGSSARADSGTFSGSFVPPACGPLHPITVVPGDTTIDVLATATVPANDITLELYDPQGNHVAHADTATSPEEIHYASASLAAGVYETQVCPFDAGVTAPFTYTGAYATSAGPAVGVPGSTTGGTGATPAPKYTAGKLTFAPATVVDPQRTEGEPINFVARDGDYWESGPWGTSTQLSFIHRSTDGGLSFHVDSPAGIRPDAPPGGGDTDMVEDDQGNVYFVDLEGLVNLGTSVSNDDGKNWRKNPLAVQNAAVDRQWFAVDDGPTASAGDNTVFMAFHETAVGIYVYSTPGSKGADDPTGGLVWQDANAGAPSPLGSDARCGQIRFDPVRRNLYYPCEVGDHVRVTIGHVDPGQRTGIRFRNVDAPRSPGGGSPDNLFPSVAVDGGGNVYAAWIDTSDNAVYYSYSTDEGSTWSVPARVSQAPATTNEFLWAQGGAPGTLALAWIGTDASGRSDGFPNWSTDPQGATAVKWYGYAAVVANATSAKPTVAQQRFTEKPMHYGQICNSGIGCTTNGGDRTMADFFGFQLDRNGAFRIVFNDTTSQHHGAHEYEVRQLKGKTALGGSVNAPAPANPVADAGGDAQWPHYSPVGPGPNQPQLDLTGVAVGQPSAGTLRVRMSVANLGSLGPPPGKASAVWLTRFQALSTGDHGEEAYRIFYVGAESTAGAAPRFFAGTTTCTETTPGNCKVVEYPAQVPATGSVCGSTIVVDVPLQGLGAPVAGDRLYSVTGLTFGRDDDTADLYADVDATPAFDYALGSSTGGGGC
jgi:hypothetical protein